jgi:hypothetical protein
VVVVGLLEAPAWQQQQQQEVGEGVHQVPPQPAAAQASYPKVLGSASWARGWPGRCRGCQGSRCSSRVRRRTWTAPAACHHLHLHQ